jgi:hypothetical protein
MSSCLSWLLKAKHTCSGYLDFKVIKNNKFGGERAKGIL